MNARGKTRDTFPDRALYPFLRQRFSADGGSMSYVDEGAGRPVVFVHGTPTWSFLYRAFIQALRLEYRCVAPDHIGFGLSDKPANWSYTVAEHAANLESLLLALDLRDVTLVVHDFGGPIGLPFAIRHPERVRSVVLFNTWMWGLRDQFKARALAGVFSGRIGRHLYLDRSFTTTTLIKAAFADKSKLTPEIHRHYADVVPTPESRVGHWRMVSELVASSAFCDDAWQRAGAFIDKPALVLWGMKDIAFTAKDLARWEATLHRARVVRLAECGHFPQEEATATCLREMEAFLR